MISIRHATYEDYRTLYEMLKDKANVEGLSEQFSVTPALLKKLLIRNKSQIIIATLDGNPVGMANFHLEDSTFSGDTQVNIKDLYAVPESRGCGIGKALLKHICDYALENDYKLLIAPLTSNQRPLNWYKKLGASLSYEASVLRIENVQLFKENLLKP